MNTETAGNPPAAMGWRRHIDPDAPPPAWLIAVLASVTATGPLAMQIFLPALPAIQHTFGVSAGTAQLTLSTSMLAIAVATLAYGSLSDRFGRRPVMLAGLVVFVVGSLICTVAPTIETLILGRVIQGAGGAAGMVIARAIARDLYGVGRAASVIARLTMIMVIAPMVAPAIGGVISDTLHWRGIFAAVTLAGLVILGTTIVLLGESNEQRRQTETPIDLLRGFARLLRSPRFSVMALFPAFSSVVFFSFISGAPYVMVSILDRPATEYGLYFVLIAGGFMLGNFLTVRASERGGLVRMMTTGTVMLCAGVAGTAAFVAIGWLNPLTLFLPMAFGQIGQGMAMPNAQAAVINLAPHRAGTASAVTSFLQMMAAGAAIQLVGTLQNGTAWPLVLITAFGAAGAMAALLLARGRFGLADALASR